MEKVSQSTGNSGVGVVDLQQALTHALTPVIAALHGLQEENRQLRHEFEGLEALPAPKDDMAKQETERVEAMKLKDLMIETLQEKDRDIERLQKRRRW